MRRVFGVALCIFAGVAIAAAGTGEAFAQKRVALVVGNSAYQHAGVLANPKNDATDMAAALKQLGIQVIDGYDLDKAAFDRKVREFALALRGADAGVLFYAGHGLQVLGRNYLVPVDAKADAEELLDLEMVRVDVVQRLMELTSKTNVLFLDACRDNPLARNLARSMGTRSAAVGNGLGSIEAGVGTLISFSTHPGAVASDGTGRNSPYTSALVKHLGSSGDDLNSILINVRRDVRRDSQGKQVPWEHSSLEGRFYFNTAAQKSATTRIESSPGKPFDGHWLMKATATSGCVVKNWQTALAIRDFEIFFGDVRRGRVEADGRFEYKTQNTNYPELTITYSGTLEEKSGTGTVATGTCSGSVALTRQ